LQIWEKYKGSRWLKIFAMANNVDALEAAFGVRCVDLEGGASGFDFCELASADHAQMYLLDLQIDPFTLVLGDGQKIAMKNNHMKIMVDPNRS
jgi:hypothetical protein